MLTKTELKYYSSLLIKKFRNSEGKFLVEGPKLIKEALNASFPCEIVLASKAFLDNNSNYFEAFRKKNIRIEIIKTAELKKLSDTKNPQGITAVFIQRSSAKINIQTGAIVALENISDPGNIGTIIRNCDWFGIETVLLSDNCAEVYSPKVIRASAGSVFHLNVTEEQEFYLRIHELKSKGYKILCADINGNNLYELEKTGKYVMIFANEANGPTQEILSLADEKITIPGRGKAESLNVASASAVVLSEFTRKLIR